MSEAIRNLMEAFVPETIDRRGYLYDDPTFGYPTAVNPFTSATDRLDGRFKPYYDSEVDLAYIRGAARNLALLTPVNAAALDRLAEYTFGNGFEFTAQGDDQQLVDLCQQVINRFVDDVDMTGTLDRELHHRSREDGEVFAYLEPGKAGRPGLCIVEPDQVREPGNTRQLDEWLADYDGVTSWSFGVRSPASRPHIAMGYHLSRDDGGMDWDYVPERRMLHIRRNVSRNAKRGVSDTFLIVEEIAREAKLRRNMAEGAALQSAIAWILEAPPGTSQASIQTLGASDAVAQYGRQIVGGGAKPQNVQRYRPGTILKPSPGLVYKPGPMGAERNSGFLEVSQYMLRVIGVRWAMPEYMVSGDASNANYSSTLVAESPFVKAREADQAFYSRELMRLLWKVLRYEWERGILPQRPWQEIEAAIEITCQKPSVASRNARELADVAAIQLNAGILSKRTAARQAGLDWEEEQRNRAEEAPAAPPAAPSPFPMREAEESYDAPEAARNNAKKVLRWRDEHGDAVQGMTQVGWTRANQLASGERLSRETVGRMAAFARHRKNAEVSPEFKAEPWRDAGYVAWLGWGGTTGVDWAAGIVGNVSESCDCGDCRQNNGTLSAAVTAALESVSTLPEARAILGNLQENCGIGAGGFQPGNQCAGGGGGGGSMSGAVKKKTPKQKPTATQINAVKDYTTDKFQKVNSELRSGKPSVDTQKITKSLDGYLERAPKKPGRTLRSFQIDTETEAGRKIASMLQTGGTFTDDAYISTRAKAASGEAEAFKSKDTYRGNVILVVNGKSGVDITGVSMQGRTEAEVLYPRGTKFKVTKAIHTPSGGILAEISEIPN